MRSAIVQQHLALLCAAACTVHQSADTRRRSRPQCDLTSDSSRELLPPRRETPTFWNWIGQALSQPEISRRRDGDMEKIQQNADLTMAVLAPPRSRTDQENPRRFDSSAVARSGYVATLDRVPSARIGSSNARPQSIILINQWCGIDSKNALDNAPCRSETPRYGPWKCFDPGTASC
jgi:hypothetical protein